jgi:glycerol transport system ATP-binding protein
MNTLRAAKSGSAIRLTDGATLPATGRLGRLNDGDYLFGFRPHDLHLEPTARDTIAVPATVAITEITGSESFVHLDAPDGRWVGLMHGIRPVEIGARVEVRLDPERFFVFSADSGRAVTAPPAAAA